METALTVSDVRTRLGKLPSACSPTDQVRIAFVEALLDRCAGKTGNALQRILAKAIAALDHYEACHQQALATGNRQAARPSSSLRNLLALLDHADRPAARCCCRATRAGAAS